MGASVRRQGGQVRIHVLAAVLVLAGCSNHAGRLALLSDGELAGKDLSQLAGKGPELSGSSCWPTPSLSNAFRDAIDGTRYDTLVDVEVESSTRYFGPSCISVTGRGVDSRKLPAKPARGS